MTGPRRRWRPHADPEVERHSAELAVKLDALTARLTEVVAALEDDEDASRPDPQETRRP